MLRLARENPRLHAALLKTHAAAERDAMPEASVRPSSAKPASPRKATQTAALPAIAPASGPTLLPPQPSASPAPQMSSACQMDPIANVPPAATPESPRHDPGAASSPRKFSGGGSCGGEPASLQDGCQSPGVERSAGSAVVRFSLEVLQEATPSSPSRRSATVKVLLPAPNSTAPSWALGGRVPIRDAFAAITLSLLSGSKRSGGSVCMVRNKPNGGWLCKAWSHRSRAAKARL